MRCTSRRLRRPRKLFLDLLSAAVFTLVLGIALLGVGWASLREELPSPVPEPSLSCEVTTT